MATTIVQEKKVEGQINQVLQALDAALKVLYKVNHNEIAVTKYANDEQAIYEAQRKIENARSRIGAIAKKR